ncbi:hypothetical protein PG989_000147 [Apiospora arundinis]
MVKTLVADANKCADYRVLLLTLPNLHFNRKTESAELPPSWRPCSSTSYPSWCKHHRVMDVDSDFDAFSVLRLIT